MAEAHNVIPCTKCGRELPWNFRAGAVSDACPACGAELQVEVFPALFAQAPQIFRAEPVVAAGESACFFHAEKKAVVPCSHCGRFLCALCDLAVGDEHLCPPCLDASRKKRTVERWDNFRVLYDSLALYLAVLPPLLLIGIYFTPVTAPASVFLAIYGWKKPASLIPRTKWRAVVAIFFGLAQIIGFAILIFAIARGINHPRKHG
jgi:hypothetical protein